MRLISLSLEQVRSYERLKLDLTGSLRQVFIGPNGSGKTNLIEAISFLSWGRSCLRSPAEDVLRFGEEFFRIRADGTLDDGTAKSFEYVWQRSPRRQSATFLSDIRTPLLQFIGALMTVVFLPEDLGLFSGAPSQRRGFLDALLCQVAGDYAALRVEYERLLKQRNALLQRIAKGESGKQELSLWDEQLAVSAAEIQRRRLKIVATFSSHLPEAISSLGEEGKDAKMVYERRTTLEESSALAEEFRTLFEASHDRDLLIGSTSVGPHRDDWHIVLRGRRLEQFASRGQQRACFLALLLVSARILEEARSERPIILLDDVLSELDDHHQAALLDSLRNHQVLITSTHTVPLADDVVLWNVGQGKLKKV